MIRTRTAIAAVIVAAGLLVLAACSGGDDDAAADHRGADDRRHDRGADHQQHDHDQHDHRAAPRPRRRRRSSRRRPPPSPTCCACRSPACRSPTPARSRSGRRRRSRSTTSGRPGRSPGLNEADIVFEEIINDGATRFAAVFHSQGVDTVGPVRSGRHPDIEILEAFDHPLFVWSGGNGGVTYYIERSELVDLSANHTSGYYRRAGRRRPVEPLHVERGDVVAHARRLPRAAAGVQVPAPRRADPERPAGDDDQRHDGQHPDPVGVRLRHRPLLPLPGRRPAQHREQPARSPPTTWC